LNLSGSPEVYCIGSAAISPSIFVNHVDRMFLLSAGNVLVFSISFISLAGFFIVASQSPETVTSIHVAKRPDKQQAAR